MYRLLAVAVIVLGLLAALGWQHSEMRGLKAQVGTLTIERDAARLAHKTEHENRVIESKRHHRLQEALDAEHLARQAVEADLRAADAAAVGLRDRARQLAVASRCPAQDPGLAPGRPPANAAGDLLADMLERLDETAGELARYADQARLAGQLCERAYDALTEKPHEQDRNLP